MLNQSDFPLTSTIVQNILLNLNQSIETYERSSSSSSDDGETNGPLDRYQLVYRNYHGIISSFVCMFGLTCNLFNIIVLTRPLMRSSTNTILTSLAFSDLLKMLFVLPAVIIFYCLPRPESKSEPDSKSYFQVKFFMIHMLFTLTLHCISTWLTVYLAGFRYVFLRCKRLSTYVSSPERALIGVSVIVIISTILCIPSYIEQRIGKVYYNDTTYSNDLNYSQIQSAYRFEETSFSKSLSLRETVFVLHSVIFKLIPCILILLFSFLLIQQLRHALQQSEILHRHSSTMPTSSKQNGRIRGRRRDAENRRTTLMLVIVCVLFLITELPQGALLLLTFLSKNNSKYYYEIYQHLGDTFDILALINNSVNFLLYCFMSRAFRDTFKQTFCHCEQQRSHHRSTVSFAQITIHKHRKRRSNQSVAYKCSDVDQTSLAPIMKTQADKSTKKKKRTAIRLQFFNSTNAVLT